MPCSPERHPAPREVIPCAVVDGNPTVTVCPRSSANVGASSANASRSSAPMPSISITQAPWTSRGNAIRVTNPVTPIAASTDGTTSAR